MVEAQKHIEALRKGDYYAAIKLVDFISNKYVNIVRKSGGSVLAQDDILPLVIYELCQTDINVEDLEALNFFVEYVSYHRIGTGSVGYNSFTLAQAFPHVIEMKKDTSFKSIMAGVDIEDHHDIKEFVRDTSAFSQLNIKISKLEEQPLLALISRQLDEQALAQKVNQMDIDQFITFQQSIESLKREKELKFNCPLIVKREKREQLRSLLIHYVNEYKEHLIQKLAKSGLYISAGKNSFSIQSDQDAFPKKLYDRYQIIEELDIANIDITKSEDIEKVGQALECCKSMRPSWMERGLLQKITDVLSLGIVPLIRSFTSKQNKLESELDETVMNISKYKP